MNLRPLYLAAAFFTLLLLVSCGSEEDDCGSNSDCAGGTVCLSYGSSLGACTATCTVAADECSGSAVCSGVGALSLNVCQEIGNDADGVADSKPEEQPRIPCTTDAECAVIQPEGICAEFEGVRDCTVPCAEEANCDLPPVFNVWLDFMTCIADQRSDQTRKACLPDKDCFANPMNCIDLGTDNRHPPTGVYGDVDAGFGSGGGDFGGGAGPEGPF